MQTRTIDTSRLRTHCWVAGSDDGEPLLLVHGNLTTGRFFGALADALPPRPRRRSNTDRVWAIIGWGG